MKAVLIGIALSLSAGHVSLDPYPKNPDIDAVNYAFELTLSDATDEIRGLATIDVRFLRDGISRLRLDLIGGGTNGGGMTVSDVSVGGGSTYWTHEADVLLIDLAAPSSAGDRHTFAVRYRGVPATGLIIGDNKYGDRTFFSDNWPNKARNWLPTIDHPSDKATSEFIVRAPDHYQVISNGRLVEETDLADGNRLTHWKQSVPIATWLYAVGVARFAVQHVDDHRGVPIQTWVYEQDRDAGFYDFATPTKQAMDFYADRIGPYSYEKLANVQSNSVGGGMEAATAIFYGDESVTGERSVRWRNVVIHEIAHQWFGNAVTEYDWDDVWLSEGFATYFTLLFIEHQYGRDEFVEGLKSSRDRVRTFMAENPRYRIIHDDLRDMAQVTTGGGTYQKGSWVLHMLRGIVGDEAFWAGIRAYYAEFQDQNATTADFLRHMEIASGMDLSDFFDQWLYRGGSLEVRGTWRYDASAGLVQIDLQQTQEGGELFAMPIQIGVSYEGESGRHLEVVRLRERASRFTIRVDREPTDVVLDPDTWVLMDGGLERRRD